MGEAPFALALATGLVAAVNPCGFALLPAYLSFLIMDDAPGRRTALLRALTLTAAMTLGFVAVFGAFGALTAPLAGVIGRHLPWVSIAIGVLLAVLGGWLLAGREVPMPKLGRGPAVTRRFGSMVLFGAAYALASLGCTVGPFLAVVVSQFRAGSPLAGFGLFVAYALGMALVVGTVALAVALARMSVVRGIRRAAPVVSRVGGALLLLAGAYVAWYGWYELRVFGGDRRGDPVVDALGRAQTAVSGWLDAVGVVSVAVVFAVLLAAAAGLALSRVRREG